MTERIKADAFTDPFPHAIFYNFYNDDELKLIWKELDFYTEPGKLLDAKDFGGVVSHTNSKALWLDKIYKGKYRELSNILQVTRKVFANEIMSVFANTHDCVSLAMENNYDNTKVRYYHDGDKYDPHIDKYIEFLGFSYFYREPKKFQGGELIFPKYDYKFECYNNSLIIFPGWVEHGVNEVTIKDSDYFDGYGRYAITSFFGLADKRKETE